MTKTIHTATCFVVVLSSLLLGCAKNFPELPIDTINISGAAPTAIIASSTSPINPIMNSDVESTVKQPDNNPDNNNELPLEFVADDLVKALSFISGMTPELTSIVTAGTDSEFSNLVKESMREQGYRFDDKRRTSGSQQLTTSYRKTNSELQPSEITAIMAINRVLIRRTYLLQDNSIKPKDSYVIRGISPELIEANELVRTL